MKRSKLQITLFLVIVFSAVSVMTVFAGERGMFQGKRGFKPGNQMTIEEMAEKKGVTVEDLQAKREEMLAKMAEKKGITVDELKAEMQKRQEEMKAKMEERLAKMAEKRGITVDELKEQMKDKNVGNKFPGTPGGFKRPGKVGGAMGISKPCIDCPIN